MIGTAYTVDVIADGVQHYDRLHTSSDAAYHDFGVRVAQTVTVTSTAPGGIHDTEFTVRLIRNGEVLAESTIRDGDVLAGFIR